jgi:hypothetical protein
MMLMIGRTFRIRFIYVRIVQVSFMLCALWRWARWAWGLAGSTHYGEN